MSSISFKYNDGQQCKNKISDGKFIFLCFVLFFGVIVVVNSIFLYMALKTQPGVVTKNAYEKGLAYNDLIQKARSQPNIKQYVSYENGVIKWELASEDGVAITNADIDVKIIRPVQKGYDFDIKLKHDGNGVYKADISLPLKGLWEARLTSKWNNKQYQTTYQFIAK